MRDGLAGEAPRLRHVVAVALFALLAGASGLLAVPVLDRDEARFVQATTQMIETGDYVTIRYQDAERNKKPVGIHWLQAGSVRALSGPEGRAVWKYRVPSLLGAVTAAACAYLVGCLLFGGRAGVIAALLLASAPVVMAEATIAKTDAVLLACVCAAQLGLARAWAGRRGPATWATFWLALGAGVLVKGPIAPMVSGLSALGLVLAAREARWLLALRPLPGLVLLAALVLPWLVAVNASTEGRFLAEALGRDMLGKVGEAQESHAGPPGYHLALLPALFLPAAPFLPAGLRWALPRWRAPGVLFCLAWALPAWAVFEAAGTKLPHYPMVAYPALGLLAGALLGGEHASAFRGWRRAGSALFAMVGVAACAAVPLALAEYQDGGPAPASLALSALVGAGVLAAAWAALRAPPARAAMAAAGASAALGWLLFHHAVPRLDALAVTPRLAAALHEAGAHPRLDDAPPVALVGYHEPSAVFTLGTDTRLTSAQGAARWLRAGPGRVAVVEAREGTAFEAAMAGVPSDRVGEVSGLDYSNGDEVTLTLVRSR